MFLFEETISGVDDISLEKYINTKKDNISCLNSQYVIKVNNKIVKRDEFNSTILNLNDKITVLPLLGGG